MNHRVTVALTVVIVVVAAPALAADEPPLPELVTTKLGERLTVVTGDGGNVVVYAGDGGVLLVDSGYEVMAGKLAETVAEISPQPVRWVINTHWHFDHVGGNQRFAEAGATVLAHPSVRSNMSAAQHLAIIDRDVEPAPVASRPTVTFTDQVTVHPGGETVVCRHLPAAHSDGDVAVLFVDANMLHTGDVVFNGGYPFMDIRHGGSIDGMIAAVEALVAMCDANTVVVPGHGPLASRSDLESYLAMLREFRVAVAAARTAGGDLGSVLQSRPTAELDEVWGSTMFPPEAFTEMVWRTLDGPEAR